MRALICILLLYFCSGNIYTQINYYFNPLQKRTGDLLKSSSATYLPGLSRFMQNLNLNNGDDWRSLSSVISIDGIPYNTLPLNYTSPDFIPLDPLQIDNIEIKYESNIDDNISFPNGGIRLRTKEISDTFLVQVRGFTGSETGDPLIYRFTREQIPIVNKNKIVPSVVFSTEGKQSIKYRITAGYFGYFAFNSSENSLILSGLGNDLTKRQNRHILGSAQLEYPFTDKKKIRLLTSFIHFYGWDIPPFITSFVHLRSFSYTNRLIYENIVYGLNAGIKYDGNISRVRELELIPTGKTGLSDIAVFSQWRTMLSSSTTLSLNAEAGRFSGFNLDPGTNYKQEIFNGTRFYFYYHFTPRLDFPLSGKFRLITTSRFEKNINSEHTFSTSLKFFYNINPENKLSLLLSSIAAYPGMFEKYGRFYTLRSTIEPERRDTFVIAGNESLSSERIKSVYLSYELSNRNFEMMVNPYIRKVENQVIMNDLLITPSFYPGDIIRDSEFINSADRTSVGINTDIKYRMELIFLGISYSGAFSKENNPVNAVLLNWRISAWNSGRILFEYFYSSSRLYKDFQLKNNVISTDSFSAQVPEVSLFNFGYIHNLSGLYYFKDIELGIRIENIFNRKIKFHPMGNNFDRAIEFYVGFKM